MSTPDSGSKSQEKGSVKTLAIRLEPALHAQLSLIAQLRGSTITDEIRSAVEAHIASAKTAPELASQAESVLDTIERDAAARRDAISTLFGSAETSDETPAAPTPSSTRSRGKRPGSEDSSES